jgi:amidase
MSAHDGLVNLTAQQAVALLKRREVSPLELVEAAIARIAATDGAINALPTLCADRARAAAREFATPRARDESPGWLAGLPIAVKDLNEVAGVRTTFGSPIFADHVSTRSDIMVETLEARGAIVLAKSNTPEFGAGANTYNAVFGETRNPWNTALTCGGSSGGSAAALAAGQVWLATGSDLGGSLRTPAGFCGVVGLRPSPGRVANGPRERPFGTLSVEGPMGRTVGDVALMLDAMSGWHIEDPMSLEAPAAPFQAAAASPRLPARIAFSADLGISPVDPQVRAICEAAAQRLAGPHTVVEEACPDLSDAEAIFATLRAAGYAAGMAPLLERHRDKLKPEVIWNIEHGLSLDAEAIGRAERARGALYHRVVDFFRRYDLLLCPSACTPPFDVKIRWLTSLEGVDFANYVEWLRLTYAITLTSCPALALPCGFTADGRPIGLQLVAPPRGEAALLSAAAAAERTFNLTHLLPIAPKMPSPQMPSPA